jgi:3-oxoacyl-[acyl-carrier protein] reductase
MKTVLITGASRGIGRACSLAFAKEGYAVAANYFKSMKEAQGLVEEIKGFNGTAFAVKADVSDEIQVKNMFSEIKRNFGKHIDVLINNAGIPLYGLFTDIPAEKAERLFEINVMGAMLCCRQALPYMISKKSGRIINISSVWGIAGSSCEAHYSASKAAVIGLTKALAKEVAPSGITVNCIAPGLIDTDMNNNLSESEKEEIIKQIPLRRMGKAEEIARLALFLSSDKASYITGQTVNISGGMVI